MPTTRIATASKLVSRNLERVSKSERDHASLTQMADVVRHANEAINKLLDDAVFDPESLNCPAKLALSVAPRAVNGYKNSPLIVRNALRQALTTFMDEQERILSDLADNHPILMMRGLALAMMEQIDTKDPDADDASK